MGKNFLLYEKMYCQKSIMIQDTRYKVQNYKKVLIIISLMMHHALCIMPHDFGMILDR